LTLWTNLATGHPWLFHQAAAKSSTGAMKIIGFLGLGFIGDRRGIARGCA